MKTYVLYDLAANVDVSAEDAEVFSMVNRGRPGEDPRVIIQQGHDLILTTKQEIKRLQRLELIRVLFMILSVIVCAAAVLFIITALSAPTLVPPIVSVALWLLLIPGLFLAGRTK